MVWLALLSCREETVTLAAVAGVDADRAVVLARSVLEGRRSWALGVDRRGGVAWSAALPEGVPDGLEVVGDAVIVAVTDEGRTTLVALAAADGSIRGTSPTPAPVHLVRTSDGPAACSDDDVASRVRPDATLEGSWPLPGCAASDFVPSPPWLPVPTPPKGEGTVLTGRPCGLDEAGRPVGLELSLLGTETTWVASAADRATGATSELLRSHVALPAPSWCRVRGGDVVVVGTGGIGRAGTTEYVRSTPPAVAFARSGGPPARWQWLLIPDPDPSRARGRVAQVDWDLGVTELGGSVDAVWSVDGWSFSTGPGGLRALDGGTGQSWTLDDAPRWFRLDVRDGVAWRIDEGATPSDAPAVRSIDLGSHEAGGPATPRGAR